MLRLTGLQRMLGGREAVKAARRILNNHVADLVGLRKTPGGTGWQTDIAQTIKFILQHLLMHY